MHKKKLLEVHNLLKQIRQEHSGIPSATKNDDETSKVSADDVTVQTTNTHQSTEDTSNDDKNTFDRLNNQPSPSSFVESSKGKQKDRLSRHTLRSLFGGRALKDYKILTQLGTGLHVTDNDDTVPSIGQLTNIRRGC